MRTTWYEKYKVTVPEGKSGDWEVKRFEAKPDFMREFQMMLTGRNYVPGKYTALRHQGRIIMSDTPDEISDHHAFLKRASGEVLINGLGLGMVLQGLLMKDQVSQVDVVELEEDVMNLVRPHYTDPRVTFHLANAFDIRWPRGKRWDFVWHDIWPEISVDNLPEITYLKRRYAQKCKWQGAWAEKLCKNLRKEEKILERWLARLPVS